MSETFQPRSEFVRTEATPQSYALVALNGADTLRCHNLSRSSISALRDVFGNETRLYGEANNGEIAEFVFRNSPWSTKSVRSETLVVQLFTTLLAHQYTFITSIDYGRQYLDKLSLTFARGALSNGRSADCVFALSFVTPTVLRVLHAPLHCTPAILQSVRGAWPRGVKDERKLGNGCWEFRLKGFGYFSAEKSDEAVVPHVFALLRTFDTHAFKLVAGVPIGGRSRNKDLWIFTAPGTSKPPSHQSPSPYQPTLESETAYSPGPFTASPTVGTSGHAKFATDEPERAPPAGHARSASTPAATPPHRKPIPPMAMPIPAVTRPTPPVANPPMTMPVPSPAKPSPQSKTALVPVPIPPSPKRNSSLLRKFRASGAGRTASGRFKHPPPPPTVPQSGHARSGSLASGEIIYETPLPGQQPLPPANGFAPPPANGFVAPPPPPPIPEQAPLGTLPSANRTEELLPQGAFRDSAFSTNTDASHDVDVLWTGAQMAKGGPGEPLTLVREESLSRAREGEPVSYVRDGEEVERSPDVTKTMHEELRPKSERAELALAGPPPPRPIPVPGSGVPLLQRMSVVSGRKMSASGGRKTSVEGRKKSTEGRKASLESRKPSTEVGRKPSTEGGRKTPTGRPSLHSKSGTQTQWVFVSVDKPPPVPGTESSTSSPQPQVQAIPESQIQAIPESPTQPEQVVKPEPDSEESTGTFKRWFGGGTKSKPRAKPRRRGGLNQAIRSSKRLTID